MLKLCRLPSYSWPCLFGKFRKYLRLRIGCSGFRHYLLVTWFLESQTFSRSQNSFDSFYCQWVNSLWDSISKLNSVWFVKTNSGISVKSNGSKKAQILRLLFVPCASDLWLRIHNVLQTIFLLHIMPSVFLLNTAKWFGDYKVLWFLSRIILTSFVFNKDENI